MPVGSSASVCTECRKVIETGRPQPLHTAAAKLPALRFPHQSGQRHRDRFGRIAEEATFLDVPCITLNTGEHPETWRVGTNELVGENPFALSAALHTMRISC